MDKKTKTRVISVVGAIVIVVVLAAFVITSNVMARTVLVTEASEFTDGQRIMVAGNVVNNSFAVEDKVLTFELCDPANDPSITVVLPARYEGGIPAAFGNDIKILCTGKMDDTGVLVCSDILVKCPAEYESGKDALTIDELLDYGAKVIGKPVKVAGTMKEGTLEDAGTGADARFVLVDEAAGNGESAQLEVHCVDGPTGQMTEGSRLVLLGLLCDDGSFIATDVAQQG